VQLKLFMPSTDPITSVHSGSSVTGARASVSSLPDGWVAYYQAFFHSTVLLLPGHVTACATPSNFLLT